MRPVVTYFWIFPILILFGVVALALAAYSILAWDTPVSFAYAMNWRLPGVPG